MATNKYVWNFDLEENVLTKDVKEDFVGKVKPIRTFTMEDVARFIAEERTEYRTETIVNIMGLVEAKIRQLACQMNVVLTDNVQYMPSVSGVFMGETGTVCALPRRTPARFLAGCLRASSQAVCALPRRLSARFLAGCLRASAQVIDAGFAFVPPSPLSS